MKKKIIVIIAIISILTVSGIAYAATRGFDLSYKKGTTDEVSGMPDDVFFSTENGDATITVSEQTPKRDGYRFISWKLDYGQAPVGYEVRYLDRISKDPVADPKTGDPKEIGSIVTETAIDVTNFVPCAPLEQQITIDADSSKNIITFYYETTVTTYTVRHVLRSTNETLEEVVIEGATVNDIIQASYKLYDYYVLEAGADETQELKLSIDEKNNIITFYYEKIPTVYRVRYVLNGTDYDIAEMKEVTDKFVGDKVTETYARISDFNIAGKPRQSLLLTADESMNVIIFYYDPLL